MRWGRRGWGLGHPALCAGQREQSRRKQGAQKTGTFIPRVVSGRREPLAAIPPLPPRERRLPRRLFADPTQGGPFRSAHLALLGRAFARRCRPRRRGDRLLPPPGTKASQAALGMTSHLLLAGIPNHQGGAGVARGRHLPLARGCQSPDSDLLSANACHLLARGCRTSSAVCPRGWSCLLFARRSRRPLRTRRPRDRPPPARGDAEHPRPNRPRRRSRLLLARDAEGIEGSRAPRTTSLREKMEGMSGFSPGGRSCPMQGTVAGCGG